MLISKNINIFILIICWYNSKQSPAVWLMFWLICDGYLHVIWYFKRSARCGDYAAEVKAPNEPRQPMCGVEKNNNKDFSFYIIHAHTFRPEGAQKNVS